MKNYIPVKNVKLGKQEYLDLINLIEKLEDEAENASKKLEEFTQLTKGWIEKLNDGGLHIEQDAFDHPRVVIVMNHDQMSDLAPKWFVKGVK